MEKCYSIIYVELIFAVRSKDCLIAAHWQNELYKYMCGIVRAKNQKVYAIGGAADHVHLLVSIKTNIVLADLVRIIKANTSKWINEKKFTPKKFTWQKGCLAFSSSKYSIDKDIAAIRTQEDYHKKYSFQQEYLRKTRKINLNPYEKQIFDWLN